jgi:hypothetical protein
MYVVFPPDESVEDSNMSLEFHSLEAVIPSALVADVCRQPPSKVTVFS